MLTPYYPKTILFADHESGFILNFYLARLIEYNEKYITLFLDSCQRYGYLPEKVMVKNEELLNLLKPIASKIGTKLKTVKRLPQIENAQKSFQEHMKNGQK